MRASGVNKYNQPVLFAAAALSLVATLSLVAFACLVAFARLAAFAFAALLVLVAGRLLVAFHVVFAAHIIVRCSHNSHVVVNLLKRLDEFGHGCFVFVIFYRNRLLWHIGHNILHAFLKAQSLLYLGLAVAAVHLGLSGEYHRFDVLGQSQRSADNQHHDKRQKLLHYPVVY